jgi:hypothetical protein
VRVPKAYPAYDSNYPGALNVIRQFLGGISNLQLIGWIYDKFVDTRN